MWVKTDLATTGRLSVAYFSKFKVLNNPHVKLLPREINSYYDILILFP